MFVANDTSAPLLIKYVKDRAWSVHNTVAIWVVFRWHHSFYYKCFQFLIVVTRGFRVTHFLTVGTRRNTGSLGFVMCSSLSWIIFRLSLTATSETRSLKGSERPSTRITIPHFGRRSVFHVFPIISAGLGFLDRMRRASKSLRSFIKSRSKVGFCIWIAERASW